jgi:hypothetical protein
MVDSEPGDPATHAAWAALYQTASQQWTHAEQLRWTLLYNYLMASTILLLAWSAVFASADHSSEKAAVLALLAFAGTGLSALWVALGLRATGFVRKYASAGRDLEAAMIQAAGITPPNSPFTVAAQHREAIAGLARGASSAVVLLVVPTVFLFIYIVLVWVSFGQSDQPRVPLGLVVAGVLAITAVFFVVRAYGQLFPTNPDSSGA